MVNRVKRKTHRNKRRHSKSRRNQMGGKQMISPADLGNSSMQEPSQLSTAQGKEFTSIHAEQHGGGPLLEGAPVGTTGVLDAGLRDVARVSFLDRSIGAIQGMSDQSGGGKRSKRSKSSKRSKRSKSSKRSKRSKGSRRRNMRGGAQPQIGATAGNYVPQDRTRGGGAVSLEPADYSSPTHLLPPSAEAKALMQMNPEWQLASNPKAFAPN
jgi:hypothetical protein